jgi:hypothetical protein
LTPLQRNSPDLSPVEADLDYSKFLKMIEAHHLPDLAAARAEAVRRIHQVLQAESGLSVPDLEREVVISDESGQVLLTVKFSEALT